MSRILTITFAALTLAAPAMADSLPAGAKLWQERPTGVGKPEAVSCYEVVKTGTRTRNLQCARNSHWARLNGPSANQLDGLLQIQRQQTPVWPYPNSR